MESRSIVIVCDVSRVAQPGERTLDGLARLQLTARRLGATVRLQNACPALVDLINCAGLADVLLVEPQPKPSEGSVEVDG